MHRPGPVAVVSRVAAGIVGGWVFVWGFVVLTIALAMRGGMSYADARTLAYLVAFLVYLTAVCWTFAAASAVRPWVVLAGGGALMTALAWWLTRELA